MTLSKNRGYWRVNGECFDNKVKAILAAQHQELGFDDVSYHYNDEWYDQHDWSVEPKETLEELYLKRAQQLREKYKTLILRYSGGADSLNILRTFVDNNIKLDIVTMNEWHAPGENPWLSVANIEKKLIAKPFVEDLVKQGAKFKVIVNDFSPTISVLGSDPGWIFDIDAPRFNCIDITAHRACTTEEFEEWNDPSTAVIVGVDKPKVWVRNGGKIWYFSQNDTLHSMHNRADHMIPEPFYWSADLPELVIKQCHVVKNYWRHHLDKVDITENDKQSIQKKTQLIPLIYPKYYGHLDPHASELPYWDHDDITSQYRNGNHQSPRGYGWDWEFHKSPYFKVWKDGIDLADRIIHRRFKTKDTIWENGLLVCRTKSRWLGK